MSWPKKPDERFATVTEFYEAFGNPSGGGTQALGATWWQSSWAMLRYGRSGLFGAVILGLARAAGETMAILMVMPPETRINLSILQPVATMSALIASQFPDSRPILKSEIQRTYRSIFDWRGGMALMVLASALLSFIIFAWDKATGLSAEERKEIGILKSIGWETSDVLLLKLWEGIVISLTAFLLGTVLAYGHVFFLSAPLFAQALKGWSVLYPRFQLTPVVDVYQLTVLFFLTVVPYTVATVIPCWRAATTDPDAAMRS